MKRTVLLLVGVLTATSAASAAVGRHGDNRVAPGVGQHGDDMSPPSVGHHGDN